MPKFKSVLIKGQETLEGGARIDGQVVWVPLDDAAMVTERAKEALAAGAWIPSSPNAIAEAQARIDARTAAERKRLGL